MKSTVLGLIMVFITLLTVALSQEKESVIVDDKVMFNDVFNGALNDESSAFDGEISSEEGPIVIMPEDQETEEDFFGDSSNKCFEV